MITKTQIKWRSKSGIFFHFQRQKQIFAEYLHNYCATLCLCAANYFVENKNNPFRYTLLALDVKLTSLPTVISLSFSASHWHRLLAWNLKLTPSLQNRWRKKITHVIDTRVPLNLAHNNVAMTFCHKVCRFFQTLRVWPRKNCKHFSASQRTHSFQRTQIWWRPVLVGKSPITAARVKCQLSTHTKKKEKSPSIQDLVASDSERQ